jgi:hypothetical protein
MFTEGLPVAVTVIAEVSEQVMFWFKGVSVEVDVLRSLLITKLRVPTQPDCGSVPVTTQVPVFPAVNVAEAPVNVAVVPDQK